MERCLQGAKRLEFLPNVRHSNSCRSRLEQKLSEVKSIKLLTMALTDQVTTYGAQNLKRDIIKNCHY